VGGRRCQLEFDGIDLDRMRILEVLVAIDELTEGIASCILGQHK
jgi:hypothetical protein